MTAYVALLRGVNVGGANRIPMADLRAVLTAHGLAEVSTVLQSGNVLFRSAEQEQAAATRVGAAIEEAFGFSLGVVARSAADLKAVAHRNPFVGPGHEPNPTTLHVVFLAEVPEAAAVSRLDPNRSPPDSFVVEGREVFISYPDGSGRSRLTLDYLERCLGVHGTARNWRTVQRLAALLEG